MNDPRAAALPADLTLWIANSVCIADVDAEDVLHAGGVYRSLEAAKAAIEKDRIELAAQEGLTGEEVEPLVWVTESTGAEVAQDLDTEMAYRIAPQQLGE